MRKLFFLFIWILLYSCSTDKQEQVEEYAKPNVSKAKFEPADGECILFVGQELQAIGGLDEYNDGYLDHFPKPGGFTMYSKIRPGDEEFGFTYSGLAGVFTTDDWGDGPSNMSMQIADTNFNDMALAIGLEMVNHEGEIARGELDSLILELGGWLKILSPRPVFLRIGYEFSGSWNHYNREEYIAAFRRIKNTYDSVGITNVAYVWQSHGWEEPMELLESWYPGDDYVDWCAYSFFARWSESNMIEFARKHNKPVFIAEATPTIATETVKENGKTKETILSKREQAQDAWDNWFVPLFKTIEENEDVVKAISYINCHWKANRMWFDNPTFQDVDARLQTSTFISEKWKAEMAKPRYLHAGSDWYDQIVQ